MITQRTFSIEFLTIGSIKADKVALVEWLSQEIDKIIHHSSTGRPYIVRMVMDVTTTENTP